MCRERKPEDIRIPEQIWLQSKQTIKDGILKKLKAARILVNSDKEVAAGIYIYCVEELGKLLLLGEAMKEGRKTIHSKVHR